MENKGTVNAGIMTQIKARVLLNSCHASLEWDMAQIFQHLGMTIVNGNMNRSHDERPLIPGYGGFDYGDEARHRFNTLTCIESDFDGIDMVFYFNPSDFHHRAAHFSKLAKSVVLYVNGQWIDLQLEELAGTLNSQWEKGIQPNIWVVVYTKREENFLRPRVHTQLQDRIHHIRFAKKISDYRNPIIPRQPYIYTTCHDIHRRAESCNWSEYQGATKGFARKLSGRNTQEVGGQGLISFDLMRQQMRECGAYMGVPCYPAPLVLNVVEAMCSGAPVAYFDNNRGIAEEGIFEGGVGKCSSHYPDLHEFLSKCLTDAKFREAQSMASLQRAREFFDFDKQVKKWETVFRAMSKLWN